MQKGWCMLSTISFLTLSLLFLATLQLWKHTATDDGWSTCAEMMLSSKHSYHWPVVKRVVSEPLSALPRWSKCTFRACFRTAGNLSKRRVVPELSSTSVHVKCSFLLRPQNKCSSRHVCYILHAALILLSPHDADYLRPWRLFIHVGEKSSGHETLWCHVVFNGAYLSDASSLQSQLVAK